jgi:hypothetical protein
MPSSAFRSLCVACGSYPNAWPWYSCRTATQIKFRPFLLVHTHLPKQSLWTGCRDPTRTVEASPPSDWHHPAAWRPSSISSGPRGKCPRGNRMRLTRTVCQVQSRKSTCVPNMLTVYLLSLFSHAKVSSCHGPENALCASCSCINEDRSLHK